MATLTVSQTKSYQRTALNDIDLIDFTNGFLTPATATFSAAQFDGVRIDTDVTIDGNTGANRIVVKGSAIDASLWTFTNWSSINDSVTFEGSAKANTLTGSKARDTITGGGGGDTITGGAERDNLNGGEGNDTFVFGLSAHLVAGETIDGGIGDADRILISGGASYDFRTATVSGVERVEFGVPSVTIFNAASFQPGGIGVVKGGAGFNWLQVFGSAIDMSDISFNAWPEGEDLIELRGLAGVANAIIGSDEADNISGNTLDDTLTGGLGGDRLFGGGGTDTQSGGGGDDIFSFASGSDIVDGETLAGGGGSDRAQLSSNTGTYHFELADISSVEALAYSSLGSSVTIDGKQIGASAIATVTGGKGIDFLQVGGAADLSGVVFNSWSLNDTISVIGGFSTDDSIIGTAFKDIITGNGGDDTVNGGAGGDTLSGGGGDDTLSYAGSATDVEVNLQTETASGGDASGDSITDFENVTGGAGNDELTGSDGGNTINGAGGDDTISGKLGLDTLIGGGGNDTIDYTNGDDLDDGETIDGGAGGQDTLRLSHVLDEHFSFIQSTVTGIERLVFTDGETAEFQGSVFGADSGQINSVTGSPGSDNLAVVGKSVDLSAVQFNNWLDLFGGDFVQIFGGLDDDTITGSDFLDLIVGLAGSDTIDGGGGGDQINGELGQDFMTGGGAADIFHFSSASHTAVGASRDRILDFNQGTDIISLSDMDAVTGGANDDFLFIGQSKFVNGEAGRLRYVHTAGGNTVIEGEMNGDGAADFQIQLTGAINLAGADFVL